MTVFGTRAASTLFAIGAASLLVQCGTEAPTSQGIPTSQSTPVLAEFAIASTELGISGMVNEVTDPEVVRDVEEFLALYEKAISTADREFYLDLFAWDAAYQSAVRAGLMDLTAMDTGDRQSHRKETIAYLQDKLATADYSPTPLTLRIRRIHSIGELALKVYFSANYGGIGEEGAAKCIYLIPDTRGRLRVYDTENLDSGISLSMDLATTVIPDSAPSWSASLRTLSIAADDFDWERLEDSFLRLENIASIALGQSPPQSVEACPTYSLPTLTCTTGGTNRSPTMSIKPSTSTGNLPRPTSSGPTTFTTKTSMARLCMP
ncbi:MAG: hypothetical protein P1V35_10680 [Planctomycetota bacterium]|nr:hypothetical protein [Planctomycetota bacterium]